MLVFRSTKLKQNESGFAALIIGIVLVLVISLLTVGFAQLMQQEQTSALNKQLSAQAYYAAESGINDATKAISAGYTEDKTSCGDTPADVNPEGLLTEYAAINDLLNNNTIGGSDGPTAASYPCLLIDPSPPNLEFNPISINGSKVIKVEGVDPGTGSTAAIKSILISWKDAAGGNSFAPSGACSDSSATPSSFYPAGSDPSDKWSYTGLLRFELIPINAVDRQSLISNEFTAFLCPGISNGGLLSTVNYSPGFSSNNGPVVSGNCSMATSAYEPNYCNVAITGLGTTPATANESTYYIDMQSIYNPTSVVVAAYSSTTPNASSLLDTVGAQTLIDSTGKAQNVLRRIQVRISTQNGYDMPPGTHSEDDICKQLEVAPSVGGVSQSQSSYNCPIQ